MPDQETNQAATTVISVRGRGVRLDDEDVVYIGRPSKWGNPFVIGKDGTRGQVIEKYENHLLNDWQLVEDLPELKGKRLACYCAPKPCHGDLLAWLADNLPEWADEWAPGRCKCGDRVVICRGIPPTPVRVCAYTGKNVENCDGIADAGEP